MTIHGIDSGGGLGRSESLNQASGPDQPERQRPADQRAPDAERTDRVEISEAARELARLAETQAPEAASGSSIDAEHMRTIVNRLTSGYYDSPEVQVEIANRIRAAGFGPSSGSGAEPA